MKYKILKYFASITKISAIREIKILEMKNEVPFMKYTTLENNHLYGILLLTSFRWPIPYHTISSMLVLINCVCTLCLSVIHQYWVTLLEKKSCMVPTPLLHSYLVILLVYTQH